MAFQASNNMLVSNHSYSEFEQGWLNRDGNFWNGNWKINRYEDYKFGFYTENASDLDKIAYNAPKYLIVRAAGNDRGNQKSTISNFIWFKDIDDIDPNSELINGLDLFGEVVIPGKDGGTIGYDCLITDATAKNVLTVGAVQKCTDYNGPQSIIITAFSSWGPTDDGRIKPDLVAAGHNIFATALNEEYLTLNNVYEGGQQGTSLAAPVATGAVALVQEIYANTHHDLFMYSSTVKALLIHSAKEAGASNGPDYKFGWGLLDASSAAENVTQDNNSRNLIEEVLLYSGEPYSKSLTICQTQDLKFTLAWTDPEITPLAPCLNPRTKRLVNDLDLRVSKIDGLTYFPFTLDVENPDNPASNDQDNNTDNVEQIVIPNAEPGNYIITVSNKGNLNNYKDITNTQLFSLVSNYSFDGCVSNINDCCGSIDISIAQAPDSEPFTGCDILISGKVGNPNICFDKFEVLEFDGLNLNNWELENTVFTDKGEFSVKFNVLGGSHSFIVNFIKGEGEDAEIICTKELTFNCNDCCKDNNLKLELIDADEEECPRGPGSPCAFKLKVSKQGCSQMNFKRLNVYRKYDFLDDSWERYLGDITNEGNPIDFNYSPNGVNSGIVVEELGCLYSTLIDPYPGDWWPGIFEVCITVEFIQEVDDKNVICRKTICRRCNTDGVSFPSPNKKETTTIEDLIKSNNSRLSCVPNPVTNESIVSYTINEQCNIKIEIYNYLGNRIKTLFNGYTELKNNQIVIQNKDFTSGIYYITLTTNTEKVSIPVIITK